MTPFAIISQVAAETGVSVDSIRSPRRWASVVAARRLCAVRLRAAGLSYPEIGRAINRHHTTVIALCGWTYSNDMCMVTRGTA